MLEYNHKVRFKKLSLKGTINYEKNLDFNGSGDSYRGSCRDNGGDYFQEKQRKTSVVIFFSSYQPLFYSFVSHLL